MKSISTAVISAPIKSALLKVLIIIALPFCVSCSAQDLSIKSATLHRSIKDGRPMKYGSMTPPEGSLILSVYVGVTKAERLPLVLELYGVTSKGPTGQTASLFGVAPFDFEAAQVTVALRPVGSGSGLSEVTDSATSGGEDSDFEFKNYGPEEQRSAKLTVKKLPCGFNLFFVVPEKAGKFEIHGLLPKPISTPKLDVPPAPSK
jgi:hypothetical protein